MTGSPSGLVEIVTTVASEREAVQLAHALVEEGLAACVSLDEVRSIYRWQGESCDEREFRIVAKTTSARAEFVEARIGALHPYETPAIVRLPVLSANADYAAWVSSSVQPGESP